MIGVSTLEVRGLPLFAAVDVIVGCDRPEALILDRTADREVVEALPGAVGDAQERVHHIVEEAADARIADACRFASK